MPRTPDERNNYQYQSNYYAEPSDPELDLDDTFDINQFDPDSEFRRFPRFRRFRRIPVFFFPFFPIFFRRRRRRRMPY